MIAWKVVIDSWIAFINIKYMLNLKQQMDKLEEWIYVCHFLIHFLGESLKYDCNYFAVSFAMNSYPFFNII